MFWIPGTTAVLEASDPRKSTSSSSRIDDDDDDDTKVASAKMEEPTDEKDDSSQKSSTNDTSSDDKADDDDDDEEDLFKMNDQWRCACEGGFLPPGMLKSFGAAESMMRLGTGQCYHKQT
jgi:hypothetical protein